jgi:hypothetical protein
VRKRIDESKFDKLYSGDEFGEFTPHVLVNVDSMSLL